MPRAGDSFPRTINERYRVLKLLGKGGMGQVFLVEDTRRDRHRMALKTLLPRTTHPVLTAGFRDEFAELARLEHPHLARAYDFGKLQDGGGYFFTTEYVPGVELTKIIAEASVEQLTEISTQLLRAMDFVHSHGLLHNDLKPANILLESEGGANAGSLGRLERLVSSDSPTVKVIDFGLISREHSAWKAILGTPRYISPERILKRVADRRSDLYSLGIVLFVLFAQRPPFSSPDTRVLLKMHLERPPPPLRSYRPGIPRHLEKLIERLLAKRPEERFQSGAEALEFLRHEAGRGASSAPRSVCAWKGGRLSAGALLHREKPLALLRERLESSTEAARESHGVIVEGPAGIGKTRLVRELRGPVQVNDGAVIDASVGGSNTTLQPLIDAALAGLQTCADESAGELRRRLARLSKAEEDPAHILEEVLLDVAARRPLLVHLDDFDGAARPIRRFVVDLLLAAGWRERRGGSAHRLLVVVSRRRGETGPGPRIGDLPVISLSGFSPQESREFLSSIFATEEIPAAFSWSLATMSEGNPLFLVELVNQLVDKGVVRYSGTHWEFPEDLAEVELPPSLDRLFEEKASDLDEGRLELLRLVAVSGRPLPREVLAHCSRLPPGRFDAALESITERGLLASRVDASEVEAFYLPHAGSGSALLEGVEEEVVRRMHQRLAQLTEECFPEVDEHADALAAHWLAAGNKAGFLRFAPRAADLLRARGDFETAVAYRVEVVAAARATAVVEKVKSLARLSEMHELLWDLDSCVGDLQAIAEVGGQLLKGGDRALLLRREACVELARHRPERALEILREAEPLVRGGNELARLALEAPRATALRLCGEVEPSRELALRIEQGLARLPESTSARDRLLRVATAGQLASLHHIAGDLERAAALLEENLRELRATEARQAIGATACVLGSVRLDRGEYEEARARLEEALRPAREIGDRRTLCRVRERLADLDLRFGRFGEALRLAQASIEDAEGIASPSALSTGLRRLARIHFEADQIAEARECLRRSVASARESGDIVGLGLAHLELARVLVEADDHRGARLRIEKCRDEAGRLELPAIEGYRALAEYELAWRESRERLDALIDSAGAHFERASLHGARIDLLLLRVRVEIEAGRSAVARPLLAQLRRLSDGFHSPEVRCEATALSGRLHLAAGDSRKGLTLLREARNLARDQYRRRLGRQCGETVEQFAVQR